MANRWTTSDRRWLGLTPYQRAAAMALMEVNRTDEIGSAEDVVGAMVNRAKRDVSGRYPDRDNRVVDPGYLGNHVSQRVYQPTFEPSQQARLGRIMKDPNFAKLTQFADDRWNGRVQDPVSGSTHYLAPESTMLALERRNPSKYKNWGPRGANWTGYGKDPNNPNEYAGVITRDRSHAFLAPEGKYSAPSMGPFQGPLPQMTPQQPDDAQTKVASYSIPLVKPQGPSETIHTEAPYQSVGPSGGPQDVAQPSPDAIAPMPKPEIRQPVPPAPKMEASPTPFVADNSNGMGVPDGSPDVLGDLIGSLGSVGKSSSNTAAPGQEQAKKVDTSLMQQMMAQEEEKRKRLALSPFEFMRA